jgi:hypothetical protein
MTALNLDQVERNAEEDFGGSDWGVTVKALVSRLRGAEASGPTRAIYRDQIFAAQTRIAGLERVREAAQATVDFAKAIVAARRNPADHIADDSILTDALVSLDAALASLKEK